MTAPVPPTVPFFTVTYQRYAVTGDGADVNDLPDTVGRNGRIVLTPNLDPPQVQIGTGADTVTLDVFPVVLRLVDGVLRDAQDRLTPKVLAPSPLLNPYLDEDGNPWNWRVDFYLEGQDSPVGFSFEATAGQTVNLAQLSPVAAVAGVAITKGEKGDQGIQGPQGIQGIQGPQGLKGDQGIQGIQGATGITGVTYRGAYSPSTPYVFRDAVTYLGSTWYAQAASTGVTPAENDSWTLLAAAATTTLTANAVQTVHVQDGAITEPKLAFDVATQAELTAGLAAKADTAELTAGLAAKADTAALTAGLAAKADTARGLPTGGTAGQVLTKTSGTAYAAGWVDAAAGGAPITRCKTANTSQASTTAYAGDPDLTVTGLAVGSYILEGVLVASGDPGGDIKFGLGGTATFSYRWNVFGVGPADTSAAGSMFTTWSTATQLRGVIADLAVVMRLNGFVTVTVAGTFALQWAQITSNATPTVLEAGSWLRLTRVTSP